MLIKAADSKQPDVDALQALLSRPDVDGSTRREIDSELRRVHAGVRGERDAAYEIEFYLGASPNQMTIHDLRLEVEGRVAQIDHLVITRVLDIWVCESKQFAEGVAVDELGEWTGFRKGRPFGIASPIEQNRKHIAVLRDLFDRRLVDVPRRLGITIKPEFHSLILVSKGARIGRPKAKADRAKVEGLASVIKADQLMGVMDKEWDSKRISGLARVVGKGTVERVARQIAALHNPLVMDWAARFGLGKAAVADNRHSCATCGRRVSQAVVDFCHLHAERFANRVLCYECQRRG